MMGDRWQRILLHRYHALETCIVGVYVPSKYVVIIDTAITFLGCIALTCVMAYAITAIG